jgi:hypothetical protein
MFSRYPTSLLYLRQTNRLRVGIMPHEPGPYTWYVLQNRPGAFRAVERELVAHGNPATVYAKWGVPLVWVYPYQLVEDQQRGHEPRPARPAVEPLANEQSRQ